MRTLLSLEHSYGVFLLILTKGVGYINVISGYSIELYCGLI